MTKIFVCSPLRGDVNHNIRLAEQVARELALKGYIPVVPHQIARYLDDENERERNTGMMIAKEMLKDCDQICIVGETITPGMQAEIEIAEIMKIHKCYCKWSYANKKSDNGNNI